jgi:hypothetical protein
MSKKAKQKTYNSGKDKKNCLIKISVSGNHSRHDCKRVPTVSLQQCQDRAGLQKRKKSFHK